VRRILTHIGEPAEPPRIAPARPCAAQSCFAWVPAQTIPGLGVRCSIAAHPPAWDDPPIVAAGGRQRMPVREYFPGEKPYRMVYVEDPFGIVF